MAAAQPRELPEVDFMDAALDAYRSNGNGAHLHEDAEDGEEPHTEQIGFAESRRPDWF